MSSEHVQQEITRLIAEEAPQAICIQGSWGVGKTYMWNSVLGAAAASLRAGGRLVIVADPHENALAPLRLVMLRELEVIGACTYEDEFPEAIALLSSGRVDLSRIVSHRLPLARLGEAFAIQMDADEALKVLVVPGGT